MSRSAIDSAHTPMDAPPPRLTFGRYIRHLRESRGWTQDQLRAKADNMGTGTLSKIENDIGEREKGTLDSLGKAFGYASTEPGAELLLGYDRWKRGEPEPHPQPTQPLLRRVTDHGLDPEAVRLAEQIQRLSRRARLHVEALILAWEEAEAASDIKNQ